MMNNLLVGQSGGPTAAINATLTGILQSTQIYGRIDQVYGARNGIEGVINGHFTNLSRLVGDAQALKTLKYTPSSALGTVRYKLPDSDSDSNLYQQIIDTLLAKDIKYFIYIGGNDSMDTVSKLSLYSESKNCDIKFIGAPKTIDNDLYGTDHSPGFGSAAKYVATTIAEIAYDISSYNIPSVTIVEIMGRNAGWLTAAAAMARINGGIGADLIYLCEKEFDFDQFINDVRNKLEQKPSILVAVSEGIRFSNGNYVSDSVTRGEVDHFGHKYIAGTVQVLEQIVLKKVGCKVRAISLNLMQRAAAHLVSETDIDEAYLLGHKALYCALQGETGKMVAIKRISNQPYRTEYITVPVSEVANKEKAVPLKWITENGNNVTHDMIDYLKPLIQGQVNLEFNNGIPKHYTIY